MDRAEFLGKMLAKGKITQEQIDKLQAKEEAIAKYKKDKASMLKGDLIKLLDTLV